MATRWIRYSGDEKIEIPDELVDFICYMFRKGGNDSFEPVDVQEWLSWDSEFQPFLVELARRPYTVRFMRFDFIEYNGPKSNKGGWGGGDV